MCIFCDYSRQLKRSAVFKTAIASRLGLFISKILS
jgi:hypothetical protein